MTKLLQLRLIGSVLAVIHTYCKALDDFAHASGISMKPWRNIALCHAASDVPHVLRGTSSDRAWHKLTSEKQSMQNGSPCLHDRLRAPSTAVTLACTGHISSAGKAKARILCSEKGEARVPGALRPYGRGFHSELTARA